MTVSEQPMPEKRLMVAVVQKAIFDFKNKRHPHIAWEAGKWLWGDSRMPFSLWWICEALSDTPDRLRNKILAEAKSTVKRQKMVLFRVDRR